MVENWRPQGHYITLFLRIFEVHLQVGCLKIGGFTRIYYQFMVIMGQMNTPLYIRGIRFAMLETKIVVCWS